MNEVMRQSCIKDCEIAVKRWNMQIQRAGHDFRWALTEPAFPPLHQARGPMCRPIRWASKSVAKTASAVCRNGYLASPITCSCTALMQRVIEPGRMAGWIPPPGRGINNLAVDYESFRLS